MRRLPFPLASLFPATFLLILQGCVSSEQPSETPATKSAPRESPEMVPLDRPKAAELQASEDDLIRAILTAKDPSTAAKGYSSLFRFVGNDGLPGLQAHTSDTIAIQAAWMQVELTVPAEDPAQLVRPDREKLAWFLGFLEGRAKVRLPKWWAEAILDARANRRGNIYAGGINTSLDRISLDSFRDLNKQQLDDLWRDPKTGRSIMETWPAKATIERKEGEPVIELGKESARLPDDFLEKVEKQQGRDYDVRALFTPTRCYVAMHDDAGYPYRLGCFERSPVRMRWASDVWGSWWSASTGVGHHWVEIVEQGDRIVVFGVSSIGFNVEAFRADNGANLFRFSNSYTP